MDNVNEANRYRVVTVFGGSGFVGRHVVRALAKRGYRIRVAVRRPDLAVHLMPAGGTGQIHAVQANVRFRDSVDRAVAGSDAVINLVGILANAGAQTFDAVQARGPEAIGEAAKAAGVTRVVHMSAIGSDPESASEYGRSKAAGEAAMRAAVPDAVIMRPSIVFGPEDDFFNRFAAMARLSPALPLIGGGETRFQPVFVGDVAEAFADAVDGKATPGTTYELGGPEVKTFRELMEFVLTETRRKRFLVPLPWRLAEFQAGLLELLPKPLLTRDQVALLKVDNVVSPAAETEHRTLAGLGIDSRSIAAIVPGYLYRFRRHGQYDVGRPDHGTLGSDRRL
jgi:NADH dehydrogenase